MRDPIALQLLKETPAETRQFLKKYGELVIRIHDLLEEKGWSQKDLAAKLEKSPSEISKWLGGDHNLTLRTLTKLEVELGEDLIQIPKTRKFKVISSNVVRLELPRVAHSKIPSDSSFSEWTTVKTGTRQSVA